MRKHAWLITNLLLGVVTVFAGYFVIEHRQNIQDWWALQSYKAPAEVQQLADQTTMAGYGRDMFYVSQPKVEESASFNSHCQNVGEKSVVLGCYTAQRIYLYRVTDPRLDGVIPVTAAHEMLHAAYERMGESDKSKLNAMLEAELPKVTDERLQGLIALYNESEPGELLNEMHSILGTEYGSLSPQLEEYYKKYFTSRATVVGIAAKYQKTFTESQERIAHMGEELDRLKRQIDTNTQTLTQQKAAIDAEAQELNQLRTTDTAAYNRAVPPYNAKVRSYNNLVVATQKIIDEFNKLVVEHNNEAAAQNSLYQSLDSRHQTVN